jgi:hypothetical protein
MEKYEKPGEARERRTTNVLQTRHPNCSRIASELESGFTAKGPQGDDATERYAEAEKSSKIIRKLGKPTNASKKKGNCLSTSTVELDERAIQLHEGKRELGTSCGDRCTGAHAAPNAMNRDCKGAR